MVVTGLSPQVVTETVYALAVERKPAWIPHEVRLVTTAEGAERARLMLMNHKTGWLHRLRREYGLPGMRFGEETLRVLHDSEGNPMADIRTAADNMAAADFLLQEMRAVTAEGSSELHVSIAGGRKTMGFFAGYALSLCGRPQDVLSHVLVDPPFESHPGFFYPSRTPRVIHTAPPESRPLDASKARVTLAEIPFVRLRELLKRSGQGTEGGFAEAVGAVQGQVSPWVRVDYGSGEVVAGGKAVRMRPAELAFYAMVAGAVKEGRRFVCPKAGDAGLAAAYLEQYRKCARGNDEERTRKALRKGMDREYFLERVSRVNRALREALGEEQARAYEIQAAGRRSETEYFVGLEAGRIEFGRG